MRWPTRFVGLSLLLVSLLATGCTDAPPPPLVTSTPNSTTPVRPPAPVEAVVGIDSLAGGVNPHALADQSAMTTALSSVVLPSVFQPDQDGTPKLDTNLMTSAEVTSQRPFIVTYTLRTDASWSDGTPIAAEDFVYLSEQMRSQPGVVDPAGYRLISGITSRTDGKAVQVTFARPYPGWRTLFDHLLPAHLLRDTPGGWLSALSDNFPASGGPFEIKSLDRDRGEVVLERNDRYWGRPALLDRIILRKADAAGLTAALGSGSDQAALLRADAIGLNDLHSLGNAITLHTVPRSAVAQVLLRPGSAVLADLRVRTAVANALDRAALIATGTESGPSAQLPAAAQVLAPSQPGYAATMPPTAPGAQRNLQAAQAQLVDAGYTRGPGGWTKDGKPLTLTVAAPADTDPYLSIASRVKAQLADAGITANVITPPANTLFGDLLDNPATTGKPAAAGTPRVDIVVGPRVVTADPATDLASAFGCPQPGPDGTPAPPNPAGFCARALQPTIDAAMDGTLPVGRALGMLEPTLWQQAVALPLFQVADVLAVRPDVTGIGPGVPLVGPFSDAPIWRRPRQ